MANAAKLTEEMVLWNSRASCLTNVKNLNCWGMNLDDVSILTSLPNLEVLNLSVNRISTLRDLALCPKLREIYLRKNRVFDLCEIGYLKHLPCLKVLWLSENPCDHNRNYRSTVLRSLPNLSKLDNNDINDEDKQKAMLEGENLPFCANLPNFSDVDLSKTLEADDVLKLVADDGSTNDDGTEFSKISRRFVDIESFNKKRAQLGLRTLKIKQVEDKHEKQETSMNSNSRILSAILLLVDELDILELKQLHDRTKERMEHLEHSLCHSENDVIDEGSQMC